MSLVPESLDAFAELAVALGMVDGSGRVNTDWFADPVGGGGGAGAHGLRSVMSTDEQRDALLAFVDDVLGDPDRSVDDGAVWVPLFTEPIGSTEPRVVISSVVDATDGDVVVVGVGVEYRSAPGPVTVATRLHVPLFRFARGGAGAVTASPGSPSWFALGRTGGRIELGVDVTLDAGAAPVAGFSIGSIAATIEIPTAPGDAVGVRLALRDVMLPGATSPRDFALDADSLEELGRDVLDLLLALVRAQADVVDLTDAAQRRFAALCGSVGLRTVAGLPPFGVEDLATRGVEAIVDWIDQVLASAPARAAWLGELAALLGAVADPARNAVCVSTGALHVCVGVRLGTGVGGHRVLTPWIEARFDTAAGTQVRAAVDLLTADLGTGSVTAIPSLSAEAVLGADAGGASLLSGPTSIGSLHTGVALRGDRRPAFVLTLHDVDVTVGATINHYPVLDLSTPQAALDAATDVVAGALVDALTNLGAGGQLVATLIGLTPPPGVSSVDATSVLSNPIGALRTYWDALVASVGGLPAVLADVGELLTGVAGALPGTGAPGDAWRIELAAGIAIVIERNGRVLSVGLRLQRIADVLSGRVLTVSAQLDAARIDLATPTVDLVGAVSGAATLTGAAGAPLALSFGPATLEATSVAVVAMWRPRAVTGGGIDIDVVAPGLTLSIDPDGSPSSPIRVRVPMPTRVDGRLRIDPADWDAVQDGVGALVRSLRLPVLELVTDLFGWGTGGRNLALGDLLSANVPHTEAAIAAWVADTALDCANLRRAMGVLATVTSVGARRDPFGSGSADSPFIAPVTRDPRAPGIAAWLEPGCPAMADAFSSTGLDARQDVTLDAAVGYLRDAATSLPDIAGLLVGRPGLLDGLTSLVSRWVGTDGVVGAPVSMPSGVESVTLDGLGFDELLALSNQGWLLGSVLAAPPPTPAVLHVGCDAAMLVGRLAGTAFDLTLAAPEGAAVPALGPGTWFVRLPMPWAAGAARPDRGGVGEQAARLGALLAARTDPLIVLAHGPAGAAALRTAVTVAAISDVVTVGTPWGPLAVEGLRSDALRLLAALDPAPVSQGEVITARSPSPEHLVRGLISRSIAAAVPGDPATRLPSAADEPRRAGLHVVAVFGSVTEADTTDGISNLVAHAVRRRAELTAAAVEPVQDSLHVGATLPVIDLDIGGLLIGVGATIELCRLERGPTISGLRAALSRVLHLDVRFGVTDGWLVGGPGAASDDLELRWLSARVSVPLGSPTGGGPADVGDAAAVIVLHDARAFAAKRERWVVRAGADGIDATAAMPEVRILLSAMLTRVGTAVPALADLFSACGLTAGGGLAAAAFDRLLHDPKLFVDTVTSTGSASLAGALRSLMVGATGTGAAVVLDLGGIGSVAIDFDAGTVTLTASTGDDGRGLPGATLSLSLTRTDAVVEASVGTLDVDAGGMRLVAAASSSGATLAVEWMAPGASLPRRLSLLPFGQAATATGALAGDLAATLLGALGLRSLTEAARRAADSAALDVVLEVCGLATTNAAGEFRVLLPIGFVDAPGAWLHRAVAAWRSDPVAAGLRLVDALASVVATGPLAGNSWPLGPRAHLVRSGAAGRLRVAVHADDTVVVGLAAAQTTVSYSVDAGLAIAAAAPPEPLLELTVMLGACGLRVTIVPALTVELVRTAPAPPLRLYPGPVGIGDVVSGVGPMVLPPVLNALHAGRSAAVGAGLPARVGQASFDLCGALDLLSADVADASKLMLFADDPGARLIARLPQLAGTAVEALARALDPTAAVVAVNRPTPERTEIVIGASGVATTITLHTTLAAPAIAVQSSVTIPSVGTIAAAVHLGAAGVAVTAMIGPLALDLGGAVLRPMLVVRAGNAPAAARLIGIGLASSVGAAGAESVQFRWTLDTTPPTVVAVTSDAAGEDLTVDGDPLTVASRLAAIAASMALGVVLPQLSPLLDTPVAGVEPGDLLAGVLFADAPAIRTVDAAFFGDLLDGTALLRRLQRLAWNLASSPLKLTIAATVEIALVSQPVAGTREQVGVRVSLPPNARLTLVDGGSLRVDLEVDDTWIEPPVAGAGLSVFVLAGDPAVPGFGFEFDPGVLVAGIGLRFLKMSGPLLDLGGVSLDAIALHLYGEASGTGAGGGARVRLDGLAFAPGGSGGTNAVANSVLGEAGQAGAANRPKLSPSLAVQKHPNADLGISLSLDKPPGPWWVIVQRQLGPIYIERVGLDTAETAGRLSRISLLFDGKVSLFGLSAAVDRLSLTWLGGDLFELSQWAVDVAGFAVSADLSGISLAGGLLKTDHEGQAAYVGMLVGRFGVYGLSVFGGYTTTGGSPSFFVFGGVTGPFGGPPAFFVTGLGGGLGINRGLRVPDDLSKFGEYPFIRALDPAAPAPGDPMAELRSLSAYFPPQLGTIWFAAGISFTSFALVDGVAVVSVAFANGLEINLFGLARMALPRPQAALVSIEIGLLARFSSTEGVFSVRGQLTDNSWLLYPEVRLTGGFAFALWWKGPLAGQFVLTLGGYHPDFRREGYPEVPRLGITWQVTDDIVLKGGSYFALTSEALMAGCDVEVSANFGWAWARLAFGAHGIVYFDPFWFEVRAYVEISAGVRIKTFFGTVSFSVSMGAHVRVWGPEFSGEATFGVGPCDLTVGFGSGRTVQGTTLVWSSFTTKYLEDGGGRARALSAITGRGSLPASTGGSISAPAPDGSVNTPFEVSAEFELTVITTIPVTRVDASPAVHLPRSATRSDGATVALGLAPMRAGGLSSVLGMSLRRRNPQSGVWEPSDAELARLTANLASAAPTPAGSAVTVDAFPIGVWGEPGPSDAEAATMPKGDVVRAANGVRLVAEADIAAQTGPVIDYYRTKNGFKTLPLQAEATGRVALLGAAAAFTVAPASTTAALKLASVAMFETLHAPPPIGVLATGRRTNLAAAAFVGERTAPPLFGTLAEGVAPVNGEAQRAVPVAPPTLPTFDGPRAPVVTALLSSGTGVADAAQRTTVADRTIARRPAPSIGSARSRLATSLPVWLVIADPPGASAKTVVAAHVPFTGVPSTLRTSATRRDGRDLSALVGGLAGGPARVGGAVRAASEPSTPLAGGDIVILQSPDAPADGDEQRRPILEIAGAARVVMLRGDGSPVFDAIVDGASRSGRRVTVAPHTRFIAVHAAPAAARADELVGWTASSRVACVAAGSVIASGCVIDVERDGAGSPVGWARAGDVVRGASIITTQFSEPPTTIAVVLSGTLPDRIDDIGLDLVGAEVVSAPAVALLGTDAVLVYKVVASDGAESAARVAVRVRSGGAWELAGVLGGNISAAQVLDRVGALGLGELALPLLSGTTTEPVSLRWIPAKPTRTPKPRRTQKSSATRKGQARGSR